MTPFLTSRLKLPQAVTYYANQVKRLGQQDGATVQIAQVEVDGATTFIAGINSSAEWTTEQTALLKSWGMQVVPSHFAGGDMTLKLHGGAPHAEENMAAWLSERRGRGIRWSRAVVGAQKDTASGSRSYVCRACRAVIERVGGRIEPPF
jgi:hypothetical protein